MKVSSKASANSIPDNPSRFVELANAAMLRASRQVIAENKRLGLPIIAEKLPRISSKHCK